MATTKSAARKGSKAAAKATAKKTTGKKSTAKRKAAPSSVPVKQTGGALRSLSDFNLHDMEKLLQDRFRMTPFSSLGWGLPDFEELRSKMKARLPDVDVVDRRSEVLIKAELPGCNKSDVDVSIADSNINIAAKHTEEKEDKSANYLRQEISSRQYTRSIPLPAGVDAGKAKADMKHGVLRIHLPKVKGRASKRLPIS